MFPSSPVSVGMFPSNRTLEGGSKQVCVPVSAIIVEQCPIADEPFTDLYTPMVELDGYS